jgi:hypothetical protein
MYALQSVINILNMLLNMYKAEDYEYTIQR